MFIERQKKGKKKESRIDCEDRNNPINLEIGIFCNKISRIEVNQRQRLCNRIISLCFRKKKKCINYRQTLNCWNFCYFCSFREFVLIQKFWSLKACFSIRRSIFFIILFKALTSSTLSKLFKHSKLLTLFRILNFFKHRQLFFDSFNFVELSKLFRKISSCV